jgi:hypothetical protein
MDELLGELTAKTGVDRDSARKALGIIISFIESEAPPEKTAALLARLPGAQALAGENGAPSGGLLGVFNDLTAAGLGISEIQAVVSGFVDYAKAKAGEHEVNAVISAIPGLGQFI